MTLLSDEELKQLEGSQEADKILDKLWADPKEVHSTDGIMKMIFLAMRETAKAQDAKTRRDIIEWRSEKCTEHPHIRGSRFFDRKRFECELCWEELRRADVRRSDKEL